MILRITLEKPISGFWDGSNKSVFDWTIEEKRANAYARVGSWEANYWFTVKLGKTDKQTLSYALRSIGKSLSKKGLKYNYEYIQ